MHSMRTTIPNTLIRSLGFLQRSFSSISYIFVQFLHQLALGLAGYFFFFFRFYTRQSLSKCAHTHSTPYGVYGWGV